jgi:hypothetical protein
VQGPSTAGQYPWSAPNRWSRRLRVKVRYQIERGDSDLIRNPDLSLRVTTVHHCPSSRKFPQLRPSRLSLRPWLCIPVVFVNNDRSRIFFKRQKPRLASLLWESHYDCVGDNSGSHQHTTHHIVILWALGAGRPVMNAANTRGLSLQNASQTCNLMSIGEMTGDPLGYPDELTFLQPIPHHLFRIFCQPTVRAEITGECIFLPEVDTNPSNG